MLAEVAGGESGEKRTLKKYFRSFPCCLVFQNQFCQLAPPSSSPLSTAQAHTQEHWDPSSYSATPHPVGPCTETSPTHLPLPTLRRKPWPAAASSLVSHFLSVPLVSFPHTVRGKSLLRLKSPGGFPCLMIKSKHLDGGALPLPHRGALPLPHPTSCAPCSPAVTLTSVLPLLEHAKHIPASGPLHLLFPLP